MANTETRIPTVYRPDHTLKGVASTASDAAAFRLRSGPNSGPLTLSLSKPVLSEVEGGERS